MPVRTDAASLLQNIPQELQDAFADFLSECTTHQSAVRHTPVLLIESVFHRYCRQRALVEPAQGGTQVIRLLDVNGYLPQWSPDKNGRDALIVRGLRLTQAAYEGRFGSE
ncbi:hypothetical protein ACIREM_00805 [Streptomyces shenzhenensis]|uniref:hypothetical protein n=1 Tax=Streptomyces shenzhenensis TaxID=943815 RepID=UPI0038096053